MNKNLDKNFIFWFFSMMMHMPDFALNDAIWFYYTNNAGSGFFNPDLFYCPVFFASCTGYSLLIALSRIILIDRLSP